MSVKETLTTLAQQFARSIVAVAMQTPLSGLSKVLDRDGARWQENGSRAEPEPESEVEAVPPTGAVVSVKKTPPKPKPAAVKPPKPRATAAPETAKALDRLSMELLLGILPEAPELLRSDRIRGRVDLPMETVRELLEKAIAEGTVVEGRLGAKRGFGRVVAKGTAAPPKTNGAALKPKALAKTKAPAPPAATPKPAAVPEEAPLANQTPVTTVRAKKTTKTWSTEEKADRRWNVNGVVVARSGVAFCVQHDDKTRGWYERSELRTRSPLPSSKLKRAASSTNSAAVAV